MRTQVQRRIYYSTYLHCIQGKIQQLERKIAVLYHAKAGKGKARKVAKWIQHMLQDGEYSFDLFETHWPRDLQNYTDAWIVGGDGTLNFFINKYPDCNIPIFIFKGGTGNDFAWKLYENQKLDGCFQLALNATPRTTDAGKCNGKVFLNGVGIGFDGEIVKSIHQDKLFFKGHLAYYAAVLRKILFFSESNLEVTSNDTNWNEKAFMLTIANGSRYGGGFLVAPEAKIYDGLFDVVLIPKISVLDRLNLLPGAWKGKHLRVAKTAKADKIIVRSNKKIAAHVDGDLIEADNFEITVLPQKFLFRY